MKPYKEPVFLFTSCSLRFAAWSGWYSAFGDKENAEKWIHQAHSEWVKELGTGHKYDFLQRYNHDIWDNIPPERLNEMVNKFLKSVKSEIKKNHAKV